ncbi:MAG: flagellar hook-length control protein FliK [Acetobacteraceae bacterium]|nr:flagellar hook-length control protein FliK [Acetobacteraceae bacterium]
MLADPVIAQPSNTITVKPTVSPVPPRGANAFEQILQSEQDATLPALQLSNADPAGAPPVAAIPPANLASESGATTPAKPARALRNDCHAASRQPADQAPEISNPTVDPGGAATVAALGLLPIRDNVAQPALPQAPPAASSAPSALLPPSASIAGSDPASSAAANQVASSSEAPDGTVNPGAGFATTAPAPAAPAVSASTRASVEAIQATTVAASTSPGLFNVPFDRGRDLHQTRATENPAQTRQTVPETGRRGGASQFAPQTVSSNDRQEEVPLLASPQAAETDGPRPRGPDSSSGITLRPVEAAADPNQSAAPFSSPLEQTVPVDMSAAMPDTASVVMAPHVPAARPVPPAQQVGSALLTLAKSSDGSQEMTIRLQPAELGRIQIRIARAVSGATLVEILAEKPATLLTLQRDQPQLHRTLDEAGIPAAGRAFTFHVVPPSQATNKDGSWSGLGGQHGPASQSAGGASTDGSSGGGRGDNAGRVPHSHSNRGRASNLAAMTSGSATTITQTIHIGIDITA